MSDLRFIRIVRKIENTRSNEDRRKKVDKYVCEYRDKDNVEFRKSFEFKVNEVPNIPEIIYGKEKKIKQKETEITYNKQDIIIQKLEELINKLKQGQSAIKELSTFEHYDSYLITESGLFEHQLTGDIALLIRYENSISKEIK